MPTTKSTHSTHTKKSPAPVHIENSTDATRGEPLAVRAKTRKAELELARTKLGPDELRARGDIDLALTSVDALLTGNTDMLSDVTAAELNRWLEHTKHLAEVVPTSRKRGMH